MQRSDECGAGEKESMQIIREILNKKGVGQKERATDKSRKEQSRQNNLPLFQY